jgi:lipopolysaccharide export LptBFGC system permease protein LptF
MDAMDPLVAVATLAVVAVGTRLVRGVPVARGLVAVAAALAVTAASSALMNWATADQARLTLLLDVMIGVALFAVYEIVSRRRRRPAS